jgi:hypothetical protein
MQIEQNKALILSTCFILFQYENLARICLNLMDATPEITRTLNHAMNLK